MTVTAKEQAGVFELSSNDRSIHDHDNGKVIIFDTNDIRNSGRVWVVEFDNEPDKAKKGEPRHARRRRAEFNLQDARAYWNKLIYDNYRRVDPPEFDYVPGYLRTGNHPYQG